MGIIGIVFFSIFKGVNSIFDNFNSNYISDINEISNSDYGFLDNNAHTVIDDESYIGDYSTHGNIKREKIYLLVSDNENKLIPIYVVNYINFFSKDIHTIYVPVIFENVKDKFDFTNGKVEAPKYYLNSNKTDFVYGYKDLDTLYNELIKPLEKEYTVKTK